MVTRISRGTLRASAAGLLLALPLCLGCGSRLNGVRGKVVYQGNPAQGALVVFHPKGGDSHAPRPSGVVGADGTFKLSGPTGQGAAAGQYAVTIVWPAEQQQAVRRPLSTEPESEPPDRLGGRYANPSNTPLEATVASGSNELTPFELK
jgi:hypothetical protein